MSIIINKKQKLIQVSWFLSIPLTLITHHSVAAEHDVVQMIKRNASEYAIDGNNGAENAQDVYLWEENQDNNNQQWYEIDQGDGYYSYQKIDTDYCLDGDNGGENRQNVYLWQCDDDNYNQHWLKVDMGDGYYRLEKRNASGYSIDGNNNGENGQSIYLWSSDDNNQNQHWYFNYLSDTSECSLPWSGSDLSISNESLSTTLGPVDISCADEITISMEIEGTGPMESADYLDIYYSLDGSDYQTLSSKTNAFDVTTVSLDEISGSELEILIEGATSYADETYTVSEISISETSENSDDTSIDEGDDAMYGYFCEDAYGLEDCYQNVVDQGGGTLVLASQTYYLSDTITLQSDVNIMGQGVDESIITWEESIQDTVNQSMFEGSSDIPIQDVIWTGFKLSCTMDRTIEDERSGHHGIMIGGSGSPLTDDDDSEFSHSNIKATNLEIENCADGWGMSGATGVYLENVNLHHNSVDNTQLYHNLYFKRCQNVEMYDSSFTDSYTGHGLRLSDSKNFYMENIEVLDNGDHGIHMDDDQNFDFYGTIDGNCWHPDAGNCHAYFCYSSSIDCTDININLD